MENKKRILQSFQSMYAKLGKQKRGTLKAFRVDLANEIRRSERQIYNLINGTRTMSIEEWEAIKKLLNRYGVDTNEEIKAMKLSKNKVVRIECTEYYDLLMDQIESDINNMWRDESGKFTYDYDDIVFEVSLSITDNPNGDRIITSLDIQGGDGYNRWIFDSLINKLFRSTF